MGRIFKVGDKVRIPVNCNDYITGNDIGTVIELSDGGLRVSNSKGKLCYSHKYELVTKTLDRLAIDDVLVDDCGFEYTILDVHGKVVDLADGDGHFAYSVTVKELRDNDFTVKGAEPEPEVTELTLQQIADKMSLPVEQIRIKEGE